MRRIDELKMQIAAKDVTERVEKLEHQFDHPPEPSSARDDPRISELQVTVTTLNEKLFNPGENADVIALSKRLDQVDRRLAELLRCLRCTSCGTVHIYDSATQGEGAFLCHGYRASNVEHPANEGKLSIEKRMDELRMEVTSLRETHKTQISALATRHEEEITKLRENGESGANRFHIADMQILQHLFEHFGGHENSESAQAQVSEPRGQTYFVSQTSAKRYALRF